MEKLSFKTQKSLLSFLKIFESIILEKAIENDNLDDVKKMKFNLLDDIKEEKYEEGMECPKRHKDDFVELLEDLQEMKDNGVGYDKRRDIFDMRIDNFGKDWPKN